jgi:beta-glucosidase
LKLSSESIKKGDSVEVSIEITNTGKIFGEEVVQLYVGDDVSSVSRPMKELKGFKKIGLQPGEKQNIVLTLTPSDLSFYNQDMKWVLEPGTFTIMVGASSEDIKFSKKLNVK